MKASRKMLGPQRASSPLLDLLGSGGFEDQPVQLQLLLARTPVWGQDLLLLLHVWRVPDRAHTQGPVRVKVHFCAQALLHGGGARQPLWRQMTHLNVDFGKGEYEAGLRKWLKGGELWVQQAGPNHRGQPLQKNTHIPGSKATGCCCTYEAITPGETAGSSAGICAEKAHFVCLSVSSLSHAHTHTNTYSCYPKTNFFSLSDISFPSLSPHNLPSLSFVLRDTVAAPAALQQLQEQADR